MGAQAMAWAIRQKCGSFGVRHLLTLLANEASDEQGSCRSTAAHLSELMGLDIRTIFRQLSTLEKAGLLYRLPQAPSEGRFVGREIVLLINEKARLYAGSEGWIPPQKEADAALSPYDISRQKVPLPYDISRRRMTSHRMTPGSHTAEELQVNTSEQPTEILDESPNGICGATRSARARARVSYNYINKNIIAENDTLHETELVDPDLWQQFEKLWPWPSGESFEPARRAFHRLSLSERSLALQWAPAFLAAQKAKNKRVGTAKNYLSDKAFEPFARGLKKEPAKAVFVIDGTPAFQAWFRIWQAEHGNRPLFRAEGKGSDGKPRKGIWRPTLFPPRSNDDTGQADTVPDDPLDAEHQHVDFEF